MRHSTTAAVAAKPYPEFPFFPHATGRWAKKIKGKFRYFGKVADDPKGEKAVAYWNEHKEILLAGLTPRPKADGFTLRELLDRFVVSKKEDMDAGEIGPRYFSEIYATCRRVGDCFGLDRLVIDLGPDDFARLRKSIAKTWGPVRTMNEIQRVRSVFNFAADEGLIKHKVAFGKRFKKPSRAVRRRDRAEKKIANGKRMFEATELRALVDGATQPLKAMILLGINAGFGPSDVANLPVSAIELKAGWIEFPRPKTGIDRRVPLWPETVAAIQQALADRPRHKSTEDAGIAFITAQGNRWTKTSLSTPDEETGTLTLTTNNPVTKEFNKLLTRLALKRKGVSFYALRHTFRTIGDETLDHVATRYIMGHADESIDDAYREGIKDERLKAVTEHVRKWLFGKVSQ